MNSRLRRLRNSKGLSQLRVAAAAGISIKTLQRAEAGDVLPMKIESLFRIAAALGVAPVDIVPDSVARLFRTR